MTFIRAILSGKIQATPQMTGQAATKKWFVKKNLSW